MRKYCRLGPGGVCADAGAAEDDDGQGLSGIVARLSGLAGIDAIYTHRLRNTAARCSSHFSDPREERWAACDGGG